MEIEKLKQEIEANKEDIVDRAKKISESGEDLKPDEDDKVLLEDDKDEIKVYMNTWKNYNEYGADLVLYDNIDGWMSIDDAIEFCETHSEDEPFINDTENVPFEVSEYDNALDILEKLKSLEEIDGYDREILGAMLSTGDFEFEEALEFVEDGDFSFYPGVSNDSELGYAIIDSIGSIKDAVSPDMLGYYIDEDMLRRDLSLDVRDMFYDTARDEVDAKHRFDDDEDFDREAAIEDWLDEHEDELLDMMVEEALDGDYGDDFLETYFDYARFGRDVAINDHVYYVDAGAIDIY